MTVEELVAGVLLWGCSCDILNGYSCGHSEIEAIIRKFCKERGIDN